MPHASISLHPYQSEALRKAKEALKRSRSIILQMPTGAGKTRTAAKLIQQEAGKGDVWFMAHRVEIVRQASKTLSQFGIPHDVIAPNPAKIGLGDAYSVGAPVKIVSTDTLRHRIKRYAHPRMAIWDECQHSKARTWEELIRAMDQTIHIGLTATPERLDGKGLSDLFEELILGPSIMELVDGGYLSHVRIFAPTVPDLTQARMQAGDYRQDDIDAVMNTPVIIGDAVREYRKHADGTRALVFATSIEASQKVAAKFNAEGVPAVHIDGKTPAEEREGALEDLAAGRIKVVSNVNVFTEGMDVPAIETVILLRPTRSLALYLQMVGRGMRRFEGKDTLTLFDHAGLVHEPGIGVPFLEREWSLEGGAKTRSIMAQRAEGAGPRKCPECSHVPEEREPVCEECGYEYPSGREVGEFDGYLVPIVGEILPGHTTITGFSRVMGVAHSVAFYWARSGLPIEADGTVNIAKARLWVDAREANGYASMSGYARHRGVYPEKVRRWRRAGLPYEDGKGVPVAEADSWVDKREADARDWVSYSEYMRSIEWKGRDPRRLKLLAGFPKIVGGKVRKTEIDEFLRAIGDQPARAGPARSSMAGMGSVAEAARVLGVGQGTIKTALRRGLGSYGRLLCFEEVVTWFKVNAHQFRSIPPIFEARANDFESREAFARRLGAYPALIQKWCEQGLPCASNGWVNIRAGLEWVRDNTDITILPEAWPKDDE